MLGFAQTALAAEEFRTNDRVNFRTGPSTDAGIISTVSAGTAVEMLEHDPAGWSKVRINGTVGYIRSDFLTLAVDSTVTFKTTTGVNFRTGPSTNAGVIRTLSTGTAVEMLEHIPDGWSKVCHNGTTGYIKSDFLRRSSDSSPQGKNAATGQSAELSIGVYRTTDGVNFRTGPSTDADIIRTLRTGTVVEMLEYDPQGWSKVRVDGTTGYIRSDFLSAGGGRAELLYWSTAKSIVPKGVSLRIVDVRTGMTYNVRCFSKGGHADVEPVTREDTETILRSRNGVWAWDPRPVWVKIGDRTIAASLNGMPHDVSTISDNGMDGHLCLHFMGTVTNNKSYERDLNNAVMEAWKAGQ